DRGRSGIKVIELPRGDQASCADAAVNVDHSRRPEVRPGEFLFARPNELHRPARLFRQPRSFDGRFAGVLAAVSRSSIRYDYADVLFGNLEGFGQFASYTERTLCAGPHGELAVVPFGHRGAGF